MSSTGAKYPTVTATASESPWSDNNWTSADYIRADDTSYASVTAATFDSPKKTYVIKGKTFDFSVIPDGSAILGVTCVIRAWYANGTGSIDLMQLLDTSGAKVGTNLASTPTALTTSQADYTFGGSTNKWGNSLTAAWVKDADFGIAIGMAATAANADVYIDYVTLTVEYRAPLDAGTSSYTVATPVETTVKYGRKLSAEVGSFSLGGVAAAMAIAVPMLVGAYALTGSEITISKGSPKVTIEPTSYAITGTDVALKVARKVVAGVESYGVTGTELSFGTLARKLAIGSSSYAVTGSDAGFKNKMAALAGSYAVAAPIETIPRWGRKLAADGSSYALVGQDASLEFGFAVDADPSSYGVTGQDITLKKASYVLLGTGDVAVTGSEVTLTYVPSGVKKVDAGAGSYELTGSAAAMMRSVPALYGGYELTGSNVTLSYSQPSFIAGGGSYAISGMAVGLIHDVWFDPGNYFITGSAAALLYSPYRLSVASRAFVITGATTLVLEIGMPCASGAFAITGSAVALSKGIPAGYTVGIGASSYGIVGTSCSFVIGRRIEALGTNYSIVGAEVFPKLSRVAFQPDSGNYVITGTDIEVDRTYKLAAEAGEFLIAGFDATLTSGEPPAISADGGSYAISGVDANFGAVRILFVEQAPYLITVGDEVVLSAVNKFVAGEAEYAILGSSVAIPVGRLASSEGGSYDIASIGLTLTYSGTDKDLIIGEGTYAVYGSNVGVVYGYRGVIGVDSYAILGTEIGWKRNYVLTCGSGAYSASMYSGSGKRFMNIWRRS